MAEKEKDVKVKPKSPLVRLNGSSSPKLPGRLPSSNLYTFKAPRDLTLGLPKETLPMQESPCRCRVSQFQLIILVMKL